MEAYPEYRRLIRKGFKARSMKIEDQKSAWIIHFFKTQGSWKEEAIVTCFCPKIQTFIHQIYKVRVSLRDKFDENCSKSLQKVLAEGESFNFLDNFFAIHAQHLNLNKMSFEKAMRLKMRGKWFWRTHRNYCIILLSFWMMKSSARDFEKFFLLSRWLACRWTGMSVVVFGKTEN